MERGTKKIIYGVMMLAWSFAGVLYLGKLISFGAYLMTSIVGLTGFGLYIRLKIKEHKATGKWY